MSRSDGTGCRICGAALVDSRRHERWHKDQEQPRIHWTGGTPFLGQGQPEPPPAHNIPEPKE